MESTIKMKLTFTFLVTIFKMNLKSCTLTVRSHTFLSKQRGGQLSGVLARQRRQRPRRPVERHQRVRLAKARARDGSRQAPQGLRLSAARRTHHQ